MSHQNLCYFKIVFLVKIIKLKVVTYVQNTGIHNTTVFDIINLIYCCSIT